ncbi:hypothetical protein MICRO80W_270059 [Micrococcus luteus]|nr:hypothetical protein MICRO80W_270059 [Micrococcus luteus]
MPTRKTGLPLLQSIDMTLGLIRIKSETSSGSTSSSASTCTGTSTFPRIAAAHSVSSINSTGSHVASPE